MRALLAVGPAFPKSRLHSIPAGFTQFQQAGFTQFLKAMNIQNFYQAAFRDLAFFSLSVDSTEQRLLKSHLELFSREHVWEPRATVLIFLVAFPGSQLLCSSCLR